MVGRKPYKIATLGSHSALQILKGAKDEGFQTIVVATPDRVSLYKRFDFIDKVLVIPKFSDFPRYEKKLQEQNTIMIPHGSFVAYLSLEKHKKMKVPYF